MDNGWAAIVAAGAVGVVASPISNWLNARLNKVRPSPADETAKRLLQEMLECPDYTWRNIRTLSNVIGRDSEKTRELLLAIGARGSEKNPEIWSLINKSPLPRKGTMDATLEG